MLTAAQATRRHMADATFLLRQAELALKRAESEAPTRELVDGCEQAATIARTIREAVDRHIPGHEASV